MTAHRLWIAAAALGLTATACGSGDSSADTDASSAPVASVDDTDGAATPAPGVDDDPEAAAANADETIDDLQRSDDVFLTEVLDVATGDATSLAQAVDGDRPVLIWFWAPH